MLVNRTIALYSIEYVVKRNYLTPLHLLGETMNRLIDWVNTNLEAEFDGDHMFVRAGQVSVGIGIGIFRTVAVHLEGPWGLWSLEL